MRLRLGGAPAAVYLGRMHEPLTPARLARFWLPLQATWLMMAIEGPFLAAVIARLPDPVTNLAAYGVAWALAILVEAPVIMMMSASTALADGAGAYRRLRAFMLALNAVVTAAMALMLIPAAWQGLAVGVLHLDADVAALAHRALLLMLPWPAAIGLRRFYQGVMIRTGHTRRVAAGTVVRLATMALTAGTLRALTAWPGAVVGAGALVAGAVAEAAAARVMAAVAVRTTLATTGGPTPTWGDVTRFYRPLALTSLISLAVQPVVTFFMGRMAHPTESLAVLPVVNALVFVFRTPGLSYQEVAVAMLGRSWDHLRLVRRFAAVLAAAAAAGLALIALTPLADLWLVGVSGLDPALAAYARTPLVILALMPALSVLLSLQRALLVARRRTDPITHASVAEVAVLAVVLVVAAATGLWPGAVAASVAAMAGRLAANGLLAPALRTPRDDAPTIVMPPRIGAVAGSLAALWALGIVQPVFDLLARNPAFLSIHGIEGVALIGLVAAVTAGPPLLLAGAVAGMARTAPRAAPLLWAALALVLLAAGLRPLVGRFIGGADAMQVAVSLGLAAAVVAFTARLPRLRRHLGLAGLAAPLVALVFLLQPGPRALLGSARGAGAAVAPGVAPTASMPVVLVVFDALPTAFLLDGEGGLDRQQYPHLAAFADRATWYRNALSVSPSTIWAVPAILSGARPTADSLPTLASYPRNIFTWLAPSHQVHSFETVTRLDPATLGDRSATTLLRLTVRDLAVLAGRVLLPAGMAHRLPSVDNAWIGFGRSAADLFADLPDRRQQLDTFLATLGTAERDGAAGCYVLHAMVPHGPPLLLPGGGQYRDGFVHERIQGDQWGAWHDDPWGVLTMQQRYLLQMGFVDAFVGRLDARLREAGLDGRAVVVLCADHGMAFAPGDSRRGVTPTNEGEILPVPLLVRRPGGGAGVVDDRIVSTLDILPTIAGALGTALPWAAGRDLAADAGRDTATAYLEAEGWVPVDAAAVMAQRAEAVARRRANFGPDGPDAALLAPRRGAQLLGRPVPADVPVRDDITVRLREPGPLVVPSADGTLPALVAGTVAAAAGLPADLDLVVAIDDTMRSVTRPYAWDAGGGAGLLSAMLPEAALGPGEHAVTLLAADWSGGAPRLARLDRQALTNVDVNLVNDPLPDVFVSGFDGGVPWDGVRTRWTFGAGSVVVTPRLGATPDALHIELAAAAAPDAPLLVTVDGRPVHWAPPGRPPCTLEVPIPQAMSDRALAIGVLSPTFVPAERDTASSDRRNLGVAVRRLALRQGDGLPGPAGAAPAWSSARPADTPGWRGLLACAAEPDSIGWLSDRTDVRVPWTAARPPAYLLLEIAGYGREGRELTVLIDGATTGAVALPTEPGQVAVRLPARPAGAEIVVTLVRPGYRPSRFDARNADDRAGGVAVRRLTLLAAPAPGAP